MQDWEEGDGNYVAPELLNDQNELTPAADIYSLGATLYECATGKPSFGCLPAHEAATMYLHGHSLIRLCL